MQRVLFLGTGGDIFTVGKQQMTSGGIILHFDRNQIHIDPGPGSLTIAKMMGINIRENTAIFLTENSLLTANDINAVIASMTHEGLDKKGVLVCPPDVLEEDSFLRERYRNFLEKTIVVDKTKKLGIMDLDVEVIGITEKKYGYKFIAPRFVVGYIPDTEYSSRLAEKYEGSDLLIINVTDPRMHKRKEHLNSTDAENIIKKVQPQLAILTGFGIKMPQAESLYETREIQKNTGTQVIAAKDGMTINPVSFTTAVRQQKLKGF